MLKKELRAEYRQKRAELSENDVIDLSDRITFMLCQLFSKIRFNHVNCFLTCEEKKEVQTQGIINLLWSKGKEVSVPYCDYEEKKMQCAELTSETLLENDEFNIPQPAQPFFAPPTQIDIVLVPLLSFDERGFRVGYGKGMYDRFLKTCSQNLITIGLSFFEEGKKISDCNENDVPMHYVVTPRHIYTYAGVSLEALNQ